MNEGLAASQSQCQHWETWVTASSPRLAGLQSPRPPEEARSSQQGAAQAHTGSGTKAGRASAYWSPWKHVEENKDPRVEAGVQGWPGLPGNSVIMGVGSV